MRLSTAKDIVLKSLVIGKPPFKDLVIDKVSKNAALEDLAKEGYITVLKITDTTGGGLLPQSVLPKGAHFINSNKTFRSKAFWGDVKEFIRGYWVIIAFILTAAIGVIQTYRNTANLKELQYIQQQLKQARDSLHYPKKN